MKRYLPLGLALCLLAGCGEKTVGADVPIGPSSVSAAPSATPTPEPTEALTPDLPQTALTLLALSDTDHVMDKAAGDLNGDGIQDWAVVIEGAPETEEPSEYVKNAPRTLTIILGDGNGGYRLGQSSGHGFIGRDCDGGIWGDPYEGISIKDGELLYTEYGGSSDRWNPTFRFIWQGDGLVLSHVTEVAYSTHTLNGVRFEYDFLTKRYEKWTYNDYCAVMEEPFEPRLLYGTKLEMDPWRLEELKRWEWSGVELPPLPSLGYYKYEELAQGLPLERSAEEMLDIVKEEHYPDMWKADISWTEETKANYSAAVGYEVPDYYYTDGMNALSYFDVEYHSYYERYEHTVMYEGTGSSFYWYWDDTGTERDFSES